ncbi:MAG TPA: vitamin K epoxide reductase family protein [Tepidisphaeraceae bacterium]|nr:vitamin K epoxide reductase family protein [Tepidisphaeraceae bacterium]
MTRATTSTQDHATLPSPTHTGARTATAILAVCGCAVAFYLALYQWHVIAGVWDPFFRDPSGQYANGSERVLNSWLSRKLPVSDAFIGSLAYAIELIADLIGGRERWRTAPWAVLVTAAVALAMGIGSAALVVIQPTLIHSWCTLCLTSAAISFIVLALVAPEAWASIQYLRHRKSPQRPVAPPSHESQNYGADSART